MDVDWEYAISVKDLIFNVHRMGDLNYQTSTYGRNRAQEGIQLHQMLQNDREETYHKEYFLKKEVKMLNGLLTIKGRADGVDLSKRPLFIEEIKSYTGKLDEMADSTRFIHWEQLYCYGYLLLDDQFEYDEVKLRLTYIHADTEAISTFDEVCSRSFLKKKWKTLLNAFEKEISFKIHRKRSRNEHLKTQGFPLGDFRKGQRELSAAVYRALRDQKVHFIEAPTGTGKTIGNLFPALKAMGEGHLDQIFFLTAKNTGKETAEKAFRAMAVENDALRALEITSKSNICFNTDKACDPEECKFARGYFDKTKKALPELKENYQHWGKAEVEEVAAKHEACPFELSLDLVYDADVVVCDYNYVFDPKVYLRRSFEEENKDIVLLIDEAHNLVSRARSMYSAELQETRFDEL